MEFSNEKSFGRGDSPRHFRCMFQPACGAGTSSDRDRAQGGRQRPREPNGFYCAAPVHAVALVANGNSGDAVAMKAFVIAAETVNEDAMFADYRSSSAGSIAARAVFQPVESI
jgi:hypothetical protein